MILEPSPISTERFTYVPAQNMLVACASDLGSLRLGRVYDDACDVGMTLISHRTGKRIVFAEGATVRDAEGDVQYTDFHPARPGEWAAGTVRIFND